jgi:hypothetical protein
MEKNPDSGKYNLQNRLRTWSELKQQRQSEDQRADPQRRRTLSHFLTESVKSPTIPSRRSGGCAEGCNHDNEHFPHCAVHRKKQVQQQLQLPPAADPNASEREGLKSTPAASHHATHQEHAKFTAEPPSYSQASSVGTPHEQNENENEDEDRDYFTTDRGRSLAIAMSKNPVRRATPKDVERWASESGMDDGRMADTLGDEPNPEEDLVQAEKEDHSLQGSVY